MRSAKPPSPFIQSQRHEGWLAVPKLYDDGGYTGANMDRPALNLLLADIARGEVNCVVVYKVDRLTRSLLDFSRIMDVLDRHGATFVAVTQRFNTTSSLGRLTLNILLSFAQFEREMISERTRDEMSAARKKGKWMGGTPVLGYEIDPAGSGLVINQKEAVQVCEIYRLYLKLGSPIRILQEIERRGRRTKSFTTQRGQLAGNAPFSKTTLQNLLTNPVYTGRVRHASETYPGEHERILNDEIWGDVQRQLSRDDPRGKHHIIDPCGALPKGMVHCASCDQPMIHTYPQKHGNRSTDTMSAPKPTGVDGSNARRAPSQRPCWNMLSSNGSQVWPRIPLISKGTRWFWRSIVPGCSGASSPKTQGRDSSAG